MFYQNSILNVVGNGIKK